MLHGVVGCGVKNCNVLGLVEGSPASPALDEDGRLWPGEGVWKVMGSQLVGGQVMGVICSRASPKGMLACSRSAAPTPAAKGSQHQIATRLDNKARARHTACEHLVDMAHSCYWYILYG